ncbi:hypothetical protein Tco_0124201, partial [Tanacetum coccineum]
SWSIPSEDRYEEAVQQLFEQAPRSLEYVPEDHAPVYIPEPEHSEDLVPAEDEAPTPLLPPFFLALRIRPLSPRALEVGESSAAAAARQPGPTIETRLRDTERRMMTALELVNRRITYQDLARSEAYSRTLEARITLLETEARRRHEWQRQAADDLAVQHIMRT